MSDPIQVEGLAQFARALRRVDADAPKGLRLAQASVKAKSTRTATRVTAGSSRAAYVPWLDYGGEGRIKGRPPKREFRKGGRYVYPAFHANRGKVETVLERSLLKVVSDAGLEVD